MTGPLIPRRQAMPREAFARRIEGLDIEAMLGRVGGSGLEQQLARAEAEIAEGREVQLAAARAAARLFATRDGEHVLEHLLDETLRRPMTLEGLPREQAVDMILRREGANGVLRALLALIAEGERPPEGDTP